MRASALLGPDGPFARGIPGYEHRPSQMRMADAVEDALADDAVLLCEAGTGTGKTLAYLVPAVLSGRKVVISTGTRALQDQIVEHDLPMLEQHLGFPIEAAVMKGLGNYLCLRRFEEFRRSEEAVRGPNARHLPVLESWRRKTTTGDRAELEGLAEDAPIWTQVMSGSDTRIGARCTHYEDCFVTRMRREAEDARLVIVNHHLYFADLAMRGPHGAAILPEHEAVIFDEAHQIEDVATTFFGVSVSTARLDRLVRDSLRAIAAEAETTLELHRGEILCRNVDSTKDRFFAALPSPPAEGARLSLARDDFTGELEQRLFALDDALDALSSHARLRAGASEALSQIARRAGQIRDDLAKVAEGGTGRRVTWAQKSGRTATVGASPVDVRELLRTELFEREKSVVLTSATLSTGGDLAFATRRLGLGDDARQLIVPSPFDYPMQAGLYLAGHLPDPRSPDFAEAATREILALVDISRGGAFVLCTSFRMMNRLAELARPHLDVPVLVQGEAPKASLLERFRRLGNAVLFATSSFWEGVDVPGDALRLVILEKLPFDVPTDPLVAARCAALEEIGESPFARYLVPSAALTLKQGFGRLIRTQKDRGIVAILDSRIVTKPYGKQFLASLPDASRCRSLDEVRAFHSHAFARGIP